jgi:hypothetical protein
MIDSSSSIEVNPYAIQTQIACDSLPPRLEEPVTVPGSTLVLWLLTWLGTSLAGGMFGAGVMSMGMNPFIAIFGVIYGTIFAGIVSFPITVVAFGTLAIFMRGMSRSTALNTASLCGFVSGVAACLMFNSPGWIMPTIAGVVGASVPAYFVARYMASRNRPMELDE